MLKQPTVFPECSNDAHDSELCSLIVVVVFVILINRYECFNLFINRSPMSVCVTVVTIERIQTYKS